MGVSTALYHFWRRFGVFVGHTWGIRGVFTEYTYVSGMYRESVEGDGARVGVMDIICR